MTRMMFVARLRHLAVEKDGVVFRLEETEVAVFMQGAVFPADAVDAREIILDVAGAFQSRPLNWYFSESRYSSRSGSAAFSHSS